MEAGYFLEIKIVNWVGNFFWWRIENIRDAPSHSIRFVVRCATGHARLLATPAAQRQARRAAARSYETKSSGARFWLVTCEN